MTRFFSILKNLRAVFLICSILLLATFSQAKDKKENPRVKFETTSGDFVVELYPKKAPLTVENFLQYVDDKFYEGTIFHRVIKNFAVQGGGMTFDFNKKETRDPVKNEADRKVKNLEATVAMARTSDPDSATAQFYINLKHNENLDKNRDSDGYAVFGIVVEGYSDTVQKIVQEPTGIYARFPNAPNYPVIIEKVYRLAE